ncbi:MAG TPA: ammonium transporter [Spirochaetia bacterium]|nr:ammonium transporter [Spirochaetia bacterium]
MRKFLVFVGLLLLLTTAGLFAQTTGAAQKPYIDFGNTAWLIVATAFVLLMTIPGLAFFYGGLVRRKNVLSVLMQCIIITAVVSLQWFMFGYSLAFGSSSGALAPFIGGFKWAFMNGIGINDPSPYFISQSAARVPHLVFALFQCMFAVITPALIAGAFAERLKFSAFLLITILWSTLVYDPIAHWVWSADGWLAHLGALDFAGGTVVHMNSGIAALVAALVLGKRRHYKGHATPPHNIPFVVLGAALLWFGWFGFNAGSGVAADGLAGSAFLTTHVATSAAVVMWVIMDWIFNGKPTVLGAATGAVAGLVAITPASGFVTLGGAIVTGLVVSIVCWWMVSVVKKKFGYDDALDAFGVHGVGGAWGALATGLFAAPVIQSAGVGVFYGNAKQILFQFADIGATLVWSFVVTWIIFKVVDLLVGLKPSEAEEEIGLDLTDHNEKAYTVID